MLRIFKGFNGMVPATDKRLLDEQYAQLAKDCHLDDGNINPIKQPALVSGLTLANSNRSAVYKHKGTWLQFGDRSQAGKGGPVNVLRSPVADDQFDRLYYIDPTDGKLKVRGKNTAQATTYTVYNAGVPRPAAAPTVAVEPRPASSWVRKWSYWLEDKNGTKAGQGKLFEPGGTPTSPFILASGSIGSDAKYAFSWRRLRSNYTGNCFEIQNPAGNTRMVTFQEYSIFRGESEGDISSLRTFVGTTGICGVKTWHNQAASLSGLIFPLTQTDYSKMPIFCIDGKPLEEGGVPYIAFVDGRHMTASGSETWGRNAVCVLSVYSVRGAEGSDDYRTLIRRGNVFSWDIRNAAFRNRALIKGTNDRIHEEIDTPPQALSVKSLQIISNVDSPADGSKGFLAFYSGAGAQSSMIVPSSGNNSPLTGQIDSNLNSADWSVGHFGGGARLNGHISELLAFDADKRSVIPQLHEFFSYANFPIVAASDGSRFFWRPITVPEDYAYIPYFEAETPTGRPLGNLIPRAVGDPEARSVYANESSFGINGARIKALFNAESIPPAFSMTFDSESTEGIISTRYVYTYVNIWGEEGSASEPSSNVDLKPFDVARISGMSQPPTGSYAAISKIRIYRAITGQQQTSFRFVTEIDAANWNSSHLDTKMDVDVAETLATVGYDPPPEGISSLVAMPGGWFAAIKGQSVFFSHPFKPYAWPKAYEIVLPSETVALGVSDTTLVALTKDNPHFLSGYEPDNIQQSKVSVPYPCINPYVTEWGGAVIYISSEGVIALTGRSGENLTEGMWSRRQWQALNPDKMLFATFKEKFYLIADSSVSGMRSYVFHPGGDRRAVGELSITAQGIWKSTEDDAFYYIDGNRVRQTEASANNYSAIYKTKEFELLSAAAPTSLRVVAENYPVTVTLFSPSASEQARASGFASDYNRRMARDADFNFKPAYQETRILSNGSIRETTLRWETDQTPGWYLRRSGSSTFYRSTSDTELPSEATNWLLNGQGQPIENASIVMESVTVVFSNASAPSAGEGVRQANKMRKLPKLRKDKFWSVQVESAFPVQEILIGSSLGQIKMLQ